MACTETEFAPRASIGRQLVRHEHAWSRALLLQKLAHELQSGSFVPAWLNEHVQDSFVMSASNTTWVPQGRVGRILGADGVEPGTLALYRTI